MNLPEERAARNEVLFREVNEEVRRHAEGDEQSNGEAEFV